MTIVLSGQTDPEFIHHGVHTSIQPAIEHQLYWGSTVAFGTTTREKELTLIRFTFVDGQNVGS